MTDPAAPRGTWYERASAEIPDERFVFMNHGYASPVDDFSWLRPGDEHQRYSRNFVRYLLSGLDLADAEVLDVGCGRGGTCAYVSGYHSARFVVGLDRSAGNVSFCQSAHRSTTSRFVRGDAQSLPFGNATLDVVLSIESSHLYPRVEQFLNEVFRTLRPGGFFCYADGFDPVRAELWTPLLERIGFRVQRFADVTENVAEALRRGSSADRIFYDEMIESGTGSAELLERLHETLTTRMLKKYSSRTWRYLAWQLERPPEDS